VYFARRWQAIVIIQTRFFQLFADDVVAQFNAFITDVNTGARDQFANLVLAFAAERTIEYFAV
jgi:hypothetical protein